MSISINPAPQNGAIHDTFGRKFSYLRIALNEACNLRCRYCMPEQGITLTPSAQLLSSDEIIRIISALQPAGVDKIRFTGGEPLLRKDVVELVGETVAIPGIRSIHLTTNGVQLAGKLPALLDAGLHGINISIDTLQPNRFYQITRRDSFSAVRAGLDAALESDIASIKINVVAMRGLNDDEIIDFAELTHYQPNLTVRFIELMPFDSHQIWKTGHFCGADHIIERLRKEFPQLQNSEGSSTEQHIFRIPGFAGKIGVIPSFTRSLCGDCSRIRLTADGQIRNCLYSNREFDLRELLRGGGSAEEIREFVRAAMHVKPEDGWLAQKQNDQTHVRDSMTQIGG